MHDPHRQSHLIFYPAESASKHSHSHAPQEEYVLPTRNLHARLSPEERLERLFMFLEAQFGADHVSPIKDPRLPVSDDTSGEAENGDDDGGRQQRLEERQRAEIERLHKIGIPVPGVAIKIDDKLNAKVWLEDLEVECANKAFGDRVRVVVERAVEVTAPLWG